MAPVAPKTVIFTGRLPLWGDGGVADDGAISPASRPCSAPASGLIADEHDLADGATSEGANASLSSSRRYVCWITVRVPGDLSVGDPSQQLRGGVRHHRSQRDRVVGDVGGVEHDRRHQRPAIACGSGDLRVTGQVDNHIGPVRDTSRACSTTSPVRSMTAVAPRSLSRSASASVAGSPSGTLSGLSY